MPDLRSAPAAREALATFAATRLTLSRMRVRGGSSIAGVVRDLTREVAEALSVARVGVWFLVEERTKLSIFHVHSRGEEHAFEGTLLAASSFPEYFKSLETRAVIDADRVDEDPRTAEFRASYTEPLGITSMLDAPILLDGEVIGVVCHEHIGPPRSWTQEERDFARSVADIIAVKLAEARKADAEQALEGMQEHLREAQHMGRLQRAAAGLSHDLNNLLTVVEGSAQLILVHQDATPVIGEIARDIVIATERWRSLARDLSDLGRQRHASPRLVAVAAHVERFAQTIARGLLADRTLEVRRDGQVGQVMIDPRQLDRIVLNLLTNARDATREGGLVTITVANETIRDADGGSGSYVLVRVDDDGEGMDAETRARVFEPYYSRRPNGAVPRGLGLSIVYEMVTGAGGFVHLDSWPGMGTSVHVYLPRMA